MQKPIIARGKEIYSKFLKDNNLTETNESFTKLLGTFHVSNRDEFYMLLGNGEAQLGDYVARLLRKQSESLLLRFIPKRFKSSSKKTETPEPPARPAINTKETYLLHSDEHGSNFRLADCCSPIPGDAVLGFVDDNNEVEIHSIDCPRALALKASYGPRIVTAAWNVQTGRFVAHIHIEGLDRFGILQELTSMISSHLAIDIRRMEIEAEQEVFHCDLWVRVESNEVVADLCNKVKTINGVTKASRIQ